MKTRHQGFRLIVICMSVALAASAQAHDTWLRVNSDDARAPVALELTSGMDFPAADYAIKPARIEKRGCRKPVGACKLVTGESGAHALDLRADTAADVAWVDLAPKTLTLDDEKVTEYLDEIDASKAIRDLWASMPLPRVWRETYVKHAKALIGAPSDAQQSSWSRPTGSALEFVSVGSINTKKGQAATFVLMEDGKAAPNVPVGVIGSALGKPEFLRTDALGQLRIELDQTGDWLIRVTRLVPPTSPKGNWNSHFATLTFKVLPASE